MNLGRSWPAKKKIRQNYAGKNGDNNNKICKQDVHFMKRGIYDSLCYMDGFMRSNTGRKFVAAMDSIK